MVDVTASLIGGDVLGPNLGLLMATAPVSASPARWPGSVIPTASPNSGLCGKRASWETRRCRGAVVRRPLVRPGRPGAWRGEFIVVAVYLLLHLAAGHARLRTTDAMVAGASTSTGRVCAGGCGSVSLCRSDFVWVAAFELPVSVTCLGRARGGHRKLTRSDRRDGRNTS